jgi:hypothetical protein
MLVRAVSPFGSTGPRNEVTNQQPTAATDRLAADELSGTEHSRPGRRSLGERASHHVEASEVSGGNARRRVSLDGPQGLDDSSGGGTTATRQSDQERPPVGLVERPTDEASRLKPIEDAAQGGGAVTQAPLQLTHRVAGTIGEEGKNMRLPLRQADLDQERFEPQAGGVRRPLQFQDEAIGDRGIRPGGLVTALSRHGAQRYYDTELFVVGAVVASTTPYPANDVRLEWLTPTVELCYAFE